MGPVHEFERRLGESWPPTAWQDLSVLVAVSGGADSVALLRGLVALKQGGPGRLVAAHFDHRLRGADSDADREFVVDLCQRRGIECHLGQWSPGDSFGRHPDGVEAAARTARYAFLQAAAAQWGARYVATAHTADDQAETVLHHIVRGTGLAGLAGMSRARPLGEAVTLIRPLLAFRRSEVLEYLAALRQSHREDATNVDLTFTRSRIRHELLPLLARDYNPQVIDSLVRLSTLAADAQAAIDGLVADLAARCVKRRVGGVVEGGAIEGSADQGSAVEIALTPLAGQPRHLIRALLVGVWREQNWPLQAMGFDEWELLADMAAAKPDQACPAKRVFPGGVVAERGRETLALHRCAQ